MKQTWMPIAAVTVLAVGLAVSGCDRSDSEVESAEVDESSVEPIGSEADEDTQLHDQEGEAVGETEPDEKLSPGTSDEDVEPLEPVDGHRYYFGDQTIEAAHLEGRPLRELRLMRNTIYARAGYEFDTDWLADHFERRDWYEGGGFDRGEFSEVDRDNVYTISGYEERLPLLELLDRRDELWAGHGGYPGEDWERPGPFSEDETMREALLVDEAIGESYIELMRGVCGDGAYRADPDQLERVDGDDPVPRCHRFEDGDEHRGPYTLVDAYVEDFSGDAGPEAILGIRDDSAPNPRYEPVTAVLEYDDGWVRTDLEGPGVSSFDCQPLGVSGREWLLCTSVFVHMGETHVTKLMRSVEDGELVTEQIIETVDATGACRFDGEFGVEIEEEFFEDITGDGDVEYLLGFHRERGEAVEGYVPHEEPEGRCDEENYQFEERRELGAWKLTADGPVEADPEFVEELDDERWQPYLGDDGWE